MAQKTLRVQYRVSSESELLYVWFSLLQALLVHLSGIVSSSLVPLRLIFSHSNTVLSGIVSSSLVPLRLIFSHSNTVLFCEISMNLS